MQLKINIEKKSDQDVVSFTGVIDEEAGALLTPLIERIGPKCLFNFDHLTSINSCGIRDFVKFMQALQKDREVFFENCPDFFIDSINMIPQLRGKAKIKSVYRAYQCDSCNVSKTKLLVADKDFSSEGSRDVEVKCDKCAESMEPLEDDDEYFVFLS